ncbi:unknown [Sutterella wadsworthensis CAG:135]|nr:unknown [Sutterella wadsworthensis CAG:135]
MSAADHNTLYGSAGNCDGCITGDGIGYRPFQSVYLAAADHITFDSPILDSDRSAFNSYVSGVRTIRIALPNITATNDLITQRRILSIYEYRTCSADTRT